VHAPRVALGAITRRQGLCAATAALALPMALRAQAQNKLPVVAFLHSQKAPPPEVHARGPLATHLRELGWEDGKRYHFLPLYAEGRLERLDELAAEAVAKKVSVIITAGTEAVRAAKRATDTIPIVAMGPDLLALGFASSLARPGGNVTGPSNYAGTGLPAKQLEQLLLALPEVKRIAYLRRSVLSREPLDEAVAAARTHGLAISVLVSDGPEEFDTAFAEMLRHRPDAIWVADSAANVASRGRIIEFAARERLPALYGHPEFAVFGGLMSYGLNRRGHSRSAAQYVDKILRGAKPGELPIEQAATLELVINLKTARALGLTMPQALLLSADRVIE
jgi:putative tryptophan/tyrosine transport system substrate-binding protein